MRLLGFTRKDCYYRRQIAPIVIPGTQVESAKALPPTIFSGVERVSGFSGEDFPDEGLAAEKNQRLAQHKHQEHRRGGR